MAATNGKLCVAYRSPSSTYTAELTGCAAVKTSHSGPRRMRIVSVSSCKQLDQLDLECCEQQHVDAAQTDRQQYEALRQYPQALCNTRSASYTSSFERDSLQNSRAFWDGVPDLDG